MAKPRALRLHVWFLTKFFRFWLRAIACVRIFKAKVVNRTAVPKNGPVIVACNHLSLVDPIFLWGALRRVAVAIAMAELWKWPIVGRIMRLMGHIPIVRGDRESGRQALEVAQNVLAHNGLVFLYPEGKCSPTGELLPFRQGAVQLAFATGAPIVPVGIIGSNKVKPLKDNRVSRKARVRLTFGEPMYSSDFADATAMNNALANRIRELSTMAA